MGDLAASVNGVTSRSRLSVDSWLVACILLCLALQAWLALVMEINWDEYYFLSQVYEYQRGELTIAPQTIHVHLFGWLTRLGGWEIRQVEIGRLVMLLCEAGTCALIYALSRAFFGRTASLLAVLAYVTAGFTMIHGASFRTDPLAAMLIMAALVLIGRARLTLPTLAATALCAALAVLVTAKVVFYAPAFLGMVAWRWSRESDRPRLVRWLSSAAIAAALLLAALYALHLSVLPRASNAESQAIMSGAARTTVLDAGLLPRAREILQSMMLSPVQTMLLLLGAAGALAAIRKGENRLRGLVALACAAPLLCLLVYRNAFPYFFAFILPPAVLLVALAVERWPAFRRHALLLAIAMTAAGTAVAAQWSGHDQRAQQRLVSAVHRMFPKPVPYIDRNGMIASFPKRGFLMSTWGMRKYRRHQQPVFADALAREPVPLLIANTPVIEQALGIRQDRQNADLFPEDQAILRDNYIPHWGAIWVAGRRVRIGAEPTVIRVAIPGTYTLEGSKADIDGNPIVAGGIIFLGRGQHTLRSPAPAIVTLRWGDHLCHPSEPPAAEPLYRGF